MMVVIDSGAGGFAVNRILKTAGIDAQGYEDTNNFPYGAKSAEFIKDRINTIVKQLRENDPHRVIYLACNTASFYSDADVIKLPKPDASTFDYFIGSKLSCELFESTLDGTALIRVIENMYRTGETGTISQTVEDTFKDVPYGARVYLGSTHFTYLKKLLIHLRCDIRFIEPDYVSIVPSPLA